jgi:peptidoglycan-associated lipoprotein
MSRLVFVPFAALLLAACNSSPKPAAADSAPPSSAAALATMNALIHFDNDQAILSDSAKAMLDEKVAVFRANPAMRVIIVGYASEPGSEDYNFALGGRRASAAKDYLVAQGINQNRIEIETRGQGELVVEGPGEVAAAQNRRDEFKLLVGSGYLVKPK